MAIPFAVAFLLILTVCLFVKKEAAVVLTEAHAKPSGWRTAVYFALFALSGADRFSRVSLLLGLAAVTLALIFLDGKAFLKVDYGLLLTFCAFFVFAGNMARIPAVKETLGMLMARDPLLFGTLCCQVISNVPSAVLLSKFTVDYAALLVAVNIGGLGTPIASLASLITLSNYRKHGDNVKKYIGLFLLVNFSFLAVLLSAGYLMFAYVF